MWIFLPRNVIFFKKSVHEISLATKKSPSLVSGYINHSFFCISWLLLGNVQDGEHWDVYRLVTIGICIAWLPIQFVQVGYQSVQIGNHWDLYRLVTLGFVQFGYHGVVQVSNHRNLYRFLLFPDIYSNFLHVLNMASSCLFSIT